MRRLAAVLLAALAAVLLPGQADPVVACRVCHNHGTAPCSKHGRQLELEQPAHGTVQCSVAAECKACAGALAVDCKTCDNPAAQQELVRRRELAAGWLQQRRAAVDQRLGHAVLHLQTAHCDLAFSIKPLSIGKEKVDTHPLMHRYGERIEALRARVLQLLEAPDGDQATRLQVFLFRYAGDHGVIGPLVTGIGSGQSSGTKLMGIDCIYSMWMEPKALPDDEALHRNVVHHVAHLLLSNLTPAQFLGNRKHGWVDEGFAHYCEDLLTGRCMNFCFEEVLLQPGLTWKNGRWRTPVRLLVDAGKAVPFAELSTRNTDQLSLDEHMLAFAAVDFLITTKGGAKFRDLVRLLKGDQPLREALQAVYGWNPLTFDAPFHAWVKANYPAVEPPR